jgi:hypothetical protein
MRLILLRLNLLNRIRSMSLSEEQTVRDGNSQDYDDRNQHSFCLHKYIISSKGISPILLCTA